jgi:phage tail sheath gpL-like
MLIMGYMHQLCGETPTDLRMGVPAPKTNFASLSIILTQAHRKATINSTFQSDREPRELEDWLHAQPRRFVMLGITAHSYDAVVWVTAQFSGAQNNWWLNRKQQAAVPDSFDSLVEELRKTSMLPNIQDDAINALLGITQGNMSYAAYTQMFNDFLRRSRQPLTNDL